MKSVLAKAILLASLFAGLGPGDVKAVWAGSSQSTGLIPLTDLGTGLYLREFQGGLYPGGVNTMPAAHAAEGLSRAAAVTPLDIDGSPDPSGKIVLLSIGFSNARTEFCSPDLMNSICEFNSFLGLAVREAAIERVGLHIVNGAIGGAVAETWTDPLASNYAMVQTFSLEPQGLSEAQVQVIWMKMANNGPSVSLPAGDADAYALLAHSGEILRALQVRYPNLQMVFVSSRIFGGYAVSTLNPEPYAYESGFAVKWLVEAQIEQMAGGGIDPLAGDLDYTSAAPWVAWGPYLWADGTEPRSDGLTWEVEDFLHDGVHPSPFGALKVAEILLDFFAGSAFTSPWLMGGVHPPGSVSGVVGLEGRANAAGAQILALLWNTPAQMASSAPGGEFTLTLPPAVYRLSAGAAGYLPALSSSLYVPESGAVAMPPVELWAGDVNGDLMVGEADLILLQNGYGMTCAGQGWNPARDFNNDCLVNILDLGLAAANHGLFGPLAWDAPEVSLKRQAGSLP